MAERQITFSRHAETVIFERAVEREWVLRTLAEPEALIADPARGTIDAFRSIPEHGGRVLHVAYAMRGGRIHVVTLFFDRKKTKQKNKT